jgi:hypothetical protein
VCASHGAAAPQVKKAAQRRLLELAEPAIAALAIALRNAIDQKEWRTVVTTAKAILDRAGCPAGAELHLEAEVGMKVDARWADALTADERRVAQWLFARAMARRGHTDAQDALATGGPGGYMRSLVGLVRAEAASTPVLPPSASNDQKVLVGEVLDADVVDEEEAA